ncbi:hypothetical protein GCM10027598_60230 [Amycolatopsis oliviviridis]|uniref:Uncharacterized protein n=1 Tax=Amycolatopsis oliviviridis TaxID=1471590 RepID=A0ABQ3MDY5_9PSEU|nr:hypothetical protein GCM10017790_83400 [Amycolatopsis oliviviridis]
MCHVEEIGSGGDRGGEIDPDRRAYRSEQGHVKPEMDEWGKLGVGEADIFSF